jgi:collagenase-like PrtC family protease
MAKFEKGHAKIPGAGRKPGQIAKTTRDVREAIARFAEGNIDEFTSWLGEIDDPARRCEIFLRMLEYHVPKLSRQEVKNVGPVLADLSDEELDRLVAECRQREEEHVANLH